MAKHRKELTAYLARSKKTSRFSADKAAAAARSFLPAIESALEEAAQLERALQLAELAEPNPERRGGFEEAFQKLGAIRRIAGDLTGTTRQLVQAFRELEAVNDRLANGGQPAA